MAKLSIKKINFAISRCGSAAARSILVLVAGVLIAGKPATAETLNEALSDAYLNNPRLLAERARQQADDEVVPQATAGWRPKVTLDGSVGYEDERTKPPPTHSDRHNSTVGVKLSQPVFRGFRTLNETRSAEAGVRAGHGKLREIEQDVLLAAATAYMNVIRDTDIRRRRAENVQFLRNEVKVTSHKFSEGELTRTDVNQAKTRLHQGMAELAQAKADLAGSKAQFASLVGHLPQRLSKPGSIAPLLPNRLSVAIQTALDENPKILAAEQQITAASHDVQAVRGELLPTVNLDASYERSHNVSRVFDQEDRGIVELRMSMPLYNSGVTLSRIRQARATLRQRKQELINTQAGIQSEVISAWENRKAARERIASARSSVTAAIASVKGIRIEAKAGERSVSDVLDAQRDLVEARISLANAERDYVVSSFTLFAAVGGLAADRLNLNVMVYDPSENLYKVRHPSVGDAITEFATVVIPPLREAIY